MEATRGAGGLGFAAESAQCTGKGDELTERSRCGFLPDTTNANLRVQRLDCRVGPLQPCEQRSRTEVAFSSGNQTVFHGQQEFYRCSCLLLQIM